MICHPFRTYGGPGGMFLFGIRGSCYIATPLVDEIASMSPEGAIYPQIGT